MRDIEVDPLNTRLQSAVPGAGGGSAFHGNVKTNREKSNSHDDALQRRSRERKGEGERERRRESGQINDSITIEHNLSAAILAQYGPKKQYRTISSGDLMSLFTENPYLPCA